jgi:Ni,Fe-hydrogenase III component G
MNTDEALDLASQILEHWCWQTETERPAPNRISSILSSADDLVPIVAALRVKRMGWLSAVTGLDPGVEAGYLEVLYHFTAGAAVITLRVRTPRQSPAVPTLSDMIPSAEVFERELHEMFGIEVVGLRNASRLYLPDDWPDGVYPLRKDFDPAVLSAQGERSN